MSIILSNKAEKVISYIGKNINSPEQRLIQGATALVSQPVIDYHNKKADDETRAVSVARTIGKIVAGTLVGVAIRYASIAAAKQFSRFTITQGEKYITSITRKSKRDIFLPKFNPDYYKEMTEKEFIQKYNNVIKTLGTILATVAMVFTNFLIDAPLTKIITNALTHTVKKQIEKEKKPEVNNAAA